MNQRIPRNRSRATSLDRTSGDTITVIGALELQPTDRPTVGDPDKILMKTSILDLHASDAPIVQLGEIFHQSSNQISYGK